LVVPDQIVPEQACFVDSPAADRWLTEFYLFDFECFKLEAVDFLLADLWFIYLWIPRCLIHGPCIQGSLYCDHGFGAAWFVELGHEDVNVLEDAARGDAEYAVGRFDEVVAFATTMLAAEMVDEAETGTELFGID
jgi:hypothetical protein